MPVGSVRSTSPLSVENAIGPPMAAPGANATSTSPLTVFAVTGPRTPRARIGPLVLWSSSSPVMPSTSMAPPDTVESRSELPAGTCTRSRRSRGMPLLRTVTWLPSSSALRSIEALVILRRPPSSVFPSLADLSLAFPETGPQSSQSSSSSSEPRCASITTSPALPATTRIEPRTSPTSTDAGLLGLESGTVRL